MDNRKLRHPRSEYWQSNDEMYRRDLEICSRWAAGESGTVISKDMGISRERVRQLLRRVGAKTVTQRAMIYKEWALLLYRAGMAQTEARRVMGSMAPYRMPPYPTSDTCSTEGCYQKPRGKPHGLCNRCYCRNYYHTNIQHKMGIVLRKRLNKALKYGSASVSAVRYLGCTLEEFRKYIEGLWEPGMSWDNWTTSGWHMDHIRPLNTFDLTDEKQRLEAIHYTNIRPLWAEVNYSRPKDGSDI